MISAMPLVLPLNVPFLDVHYPHSTSYRVYISQHIRVVGGAMVLGKLPVPGRPTYLDDSRARAYCACTRCGWELFGHFFSSLSFLFFLPLSGRRPDVD